MYTFINLQKIIGTLPLYEKTKLKVEGAELVNVCLEDIFGELLDYEKKEFIENNADRIAAECSDVMTFRNVYYIENEESDYDKLSSIDDDTIALYLQDQGYQVEGY